MLKCTQSLMFPVARLLRSSSRFNRPSSNVSNDRHRHMKADHGPLSISRRSQRRSRASNIPLHTRSDKTQRRSAIERSAENESRNKDDHARQRRMSSIVRLPRVNGADLYVVRTTKAALACAKPCWRCVEWCRWAGIRRIFHWDPTSASFKCIKVSDAMIEHYQTQADQRLSEQARLPIS